MAERVDPETMAYTFSEHVHDTEEAPYAYLRRFLEELLALEPGLRQHVSDLVIDDLKEAIGSRETVELIETVEDEWRAHD